MPVGSQGGNKSSTAHDKKNNIRAGSKAKRSENATGGVVKDGVTVKGNPANSKLPK